MRFFYTSLITSSLALSLYVSMFQNGTLIYPFIFSTMLAFLLMLEIEKNKLIGNEYYGTDQECWEYSTKKEKMEYRKAYFAAHVRCHLEMKLMSESKNKTQIKWMIQRMDAYYGMS